MSSSARFLIAAALLAVTAIFLHARSRNEVLPMRQPLKAFPQQLGEWSGTDVAISHDVLDVLGQGDFLLRVYQDDSGRNPDVDLFLAYFSNQRAGDTIHSPKNCLPGAGWSPIEASRISISSPGRAPFPANPYLISKGAERQLVLYWYWAHDRAVASEYAAKFYLVTDSIRMNRSDGSLIRVSTALGPDQDVESAQQLLLSFAGEVVPRINTYVPR